MHSFFRQGRTTKVAITFKVSHNYLGVWKQRWKGYVLEFYRYANLEFSYKSKPIEVAKNHTVPTSDVQRLPMECIQDTAPLSFQQPYLEPIHGKEGSTVNVNLPTQTIVSTKFADPRLWLCNFGETNARVMFAEGRAEKNGHKLVVLVCVPPNQSNKRTVPVTIDCLPDVGTIAKHECEFTYENEQIAEVKAVPSVVQNTSDNQLDRSIEDLLIEPPEFWGKLQELTNDDFPISVGAHELTRRFLFDLLREVGASMIENTQEV